MGGLKAAFGRCVRALCRLNKLGLYLTQEKQDAILRGDTSNSVVNRHFLDGLQAMGMHLCGTPEQMPVMIRLQVKYVQEAWESLIQLNQTNQERVKVQALVLVTHSATILGLNATTQLYLLKICKIIENEKFQFLTEYGLPAEFSEQVREEVSVLSQTIYLENYCYLALGGSPPVKTEDRERV